MARTEFFVTKQPGGMFTVHNVDVHPGDIFFVSSDTGIDGVGRGRNPDDPVATIDYAIGLCTASKCDRIYVMPGHTETISGATSLVMDVAGVQIIGLGSGSLIPTLTFSAAASTISITAANCVLKNFILVGDYTGGVTAGITVATAGTYLILDGIQWRPGSSTKEFLKALTVAADMDDMTIQNCRYDGVSGGDESAAFYFAGGSDRTIIKNNYLLGDFSEAAIDWDAAASTEILIERNFVYNFDASAGLLIEVHDSSTGVARLNNGYSAKNNAGVIAGDALAQFQNKITSALTASGLLLPTADS